MSAGLLMRPRFVAALLAAAALGCNLGNSALERLPTCDNDDDCAGDEICFPDGCGDPGRDIVVELLPNAAGGQLAQDFRIDAITPVQNLSAAGPAAIEGTLHQETSSGVGHVTYPGEVTIRATGESLLIPGRKRSVQATVTADETGRYTMAAPSGAFSAIATSKDVLFPPLYTPLVVVEPGGSSELSWSFPSASSLVRIDGSLLRTESSGVAIQEAEMQIQAFDPVTDQAISQRAHVSSGTANSTGAFYVYVKTTPGQELVYLKASPKDPAALVPTRMFAVPLNAKLMQPLEMGEYGTPVSVTGRITSTNLVPIADASVYFEGEAAGGGTFRTQSAKTDVNGVFVLTTLPSRKNGVLAMWVAPPADSGSGVLRSFVPVEQSGGDLGSFQAPDKVDLSGTLANPDGSPARGVIIKAEPVAAVDGAPLPSGITSSQTDDVGSFQLKLDPATWRLDFIPTDFQPRVSRFVTVRSTPGSTGEGAVPIVLPEFHLSRGRTVKGVVSSIPDRNGSSSAPAPFASVKFFRVVSFEGNWSALLLAEGVSDANGNYSVVLPTR